MNCELLHIQNQISRGNEKAFTELYGLFNRRLFHFSKAIVKSAEMAEEVVEDVFVKLWSNRLHLVSIQNLAVYLYVAVKNRSLNAISKKTEAMMRSPFDDLDVEIGPTAIDPYNLMVGSELIRQMNQAIEALPPRCKLVFKLVREDGLSYKEVSEILGIAINTIDVQMAIAIKKICTRLHAGGFTASVHRKIKQIKKGH
jgi:RNA polymerase sigma-70 factor (family 1)